MPAMEEQIILDAQGTCTPFPHFWEHMFGSCHASVTLCEDWRNDLRALREIVDVRYIRFHGIFEHQVGIYGGQDPAGNLLLNFTRVDLIYDGLRKIGVYPFVELGFMPEELAERPSFHQFWYHPNVAPPRDPHQWYQLIFGFARHLVERYGIEDVANWYFEVWNEPNLDFWTGEPKEETYYALYDIAATALKEVSRASGWGDRPPRKLLGSIVSFSIVWERMCPLTSCPRTSIRMTLRKIFSEKRKTFRNQKWWRARYAKFTSKSRLLPGPNCLLSGANTMRASTRCNWIRPT